MSDHSTAELKRQFDQATERESLARKAAFTAREVYQARLCFDRLAELDARGIFSGDKVILVDRRSGERKAIGFLGVEPTAWGSTSEILGGLKKDGTPSASRRHFNEGTLEPWEGSPEQAQEQGK
jgi:hypothetical protein